MSDFTPALCRCAHPVCSKAIPRGMFACTSHWFSLPQAMQDELLDARATFCREDGSSSSVRVLTASETSARNYWKENQIV